MNTHAKQPFGTVFPVANFLGIRLLSREDGRAGAELEATEQHANPNGYIARWYLLRSGGCRYECGFC
jgi:acyl-coenzyme A thioesterase PaaI-like protein